MRTFEIGALIVVSIAIVMLWIAIAWSVTSH